MSSRSLYERTLVCTLVAACCGLIPAFGANPAPSQLFYVPVPESDQLAAYSAINSAAVDPLNIFVTFSAASDKTVIYYDHWEDGYEQDITSPTQATTQIFGDGNQANGYPPGNAADLISAGTVFSLRNYVTSSQGSTVIKFDSRDKIASFKPISLTKTSFPASTNSLLAGCVEVFERGLWGTEYRVPVGADMPTTTATATLTHDADMFAYTSISVMAGAGGANVQIDANNDGVFEQNPVLVEGGSITLSGVSAGARVLSDKPVQVVMFTGRPGSNYQSRDTSLLPAYRWSSSYYAPVSTPATYGTVVFLYNPGASAITVSYDYRSSTSAYTTGTVSVPAGGNARVTLSPASGTAHYGAYRFYTTGAAPSIFYAFCAVDAASANTGDNQAFDGGFTLVGQPSLSTQVLLSLGIGRDPNSTTNPNENGNPVWITTAGNGHTAETVYVDYNGDNAGALADVNGNRYDTSYSLRELQQQKIFDPDGDQSGMLVYVLNPNVKIAAAWAQDPAVASASQPGLDVSTLIPPLREGDGSKGSTIAIDTDGDGRKSAGDTLEYDIRTVNTARTGIVGPFTVKDNLPVDLSYVIGSAKYRYSVGGAWQAWVTIPDDGSGTAFPLDVVGYNIPGTLGVGQQIQVVFRAAIKSYADLTPGLKEIVNTGNIVMTPLGVTLDIGSSDPLYGSIGDRIWNDADGDGVQDIGEAGLNNVRVYLDTNNNGLRDSTEPTVLTSGDGAYVFNGLLAGNHGVRVDPSTVAALNPGYGATYDLDGIATAYAATVTLASAQDRVDADFGFRVGASVGDRVWMDRDGDGVQEAGEPGINGVRVYVDTNNNNACDSGEPSMLTNGDGAYSIGNLIPGSHAVRVDTATLPSGAAQTFDPNGGLDHEAAVSLISAEHRGDLDFGYRGTLSIGDLVWEDSNGNGSVTTSSTNYSVNNGRVDINGDGNENDSDDGFIGSMRIINGYVDIDNDTQADNDDDGTFLGVAIVNGGFDLNGSGGISTSGNNDDGTVTYTVNEAGIASVRVYIDINGDGIFNSTEPSALTNSGGAYTVGNLFNGTYTVRADTTTLPTSYVQTHDLTSPSTDHSAIVVISGSSRTDVDFGYRNDASIGDLVWNDRDADGVVDAGEPGIEGAIVYIDANSNGIFDQATERYAITNFNGYYLIDNLPAGSYLVRIDISSLPQGSTQTHDFDGTGSAHRATRTLVTSEDAVNVDFGYRATASVGDFVWNDIDADGIQDSGETGISGVRVYLDINGNGTHESAIEPAATTDSAGAYTIGSLVPGTYTVRVDTSTLSSTLVQTYDAAGDVDNAATFSLSAAQARSDIDFGYTTRVTIGDFVWNDTNANGQQNSGETGISGLTVTVFNAANDTIAATTTTNAAGAYSFTLMPGAYYLVFDKPAGYNATLADNGVDATDSDANVTTGRTPDVTLTGGQSNVTLDAGFYQPGSISGTVFADTDNNDTGDVPILNVTLALKDSSGNSIDGDPNTSGAQPVTTTTAPDGSYIFGNLLPGSYGVVESQPPGYHSVSDKDAGNPDEIRPITVTAGNANSGNDFIEEQPGSLSGAVLADTDGDADGDTPLAGVVIRLLDDAGSPLLDGLGAPVSTTTLGDGTYAFGGLTPRFYRVYQDQPSNYNSVSDTGGANNNRIGDETPVVVTAGNNTGGNDFIEIELGVISGYVLLDTDNNGSGDAPLSGVVLHLLDGSGNPVLDGLGAPIQVASGAGGYYGFTQVPVGTYRVSQSQPATYGSVSDVDGANNNIIGDQTPVVITPGLIVTNRNFVEIVLGSIAGAVREDTDNSGSGDAPLAGVTLTLLDSTGNPVDGDPVTTGVQPVTQVTDVDGNYHFADLFPGNYQIWENQPSGYGSVSDVDAGNPDIIGATTAIAVAPGQHVTGRDFVEIRLGSISGYVHVGSAPLAGVTLTLLDEDGNPVDGDPGEPGVQPITTVTDSSGHYTFAGVMPGDYQVAQIQPLAYDSFGDLDGGDINIIGDVTRISVLPGQENADNDFSETLDTCPDDWDQWEIQHPGQLADGNPDSDNYDNLNEFAFAMPVDNGSGSPWLGDTAWIIRPSELAPGTLEGVFVRPKGATQDLTYTLEYVASLTSPIVWSSMEITPSVITTVDNGDCTETITIHDLEGLTGLEDGVGFVRIRADLDEDGDTTTDHTSRVEVEGWKETGLELCCRTYGHPFLRETSFTGTVGTVDSQDISFTASGGGGLDLSMLLAPGAGYYIEVVSGDNEGHRFDVVSATANSLTLANDADLHAATAPYNTFAGDLPANLAGDRIVLHRHWTLGEIFPVDGFGGTANRNTADQIHAFADGQWSIYWLYDDGGSDPHWVKTGDGTYADRGATVLPPGYGVFFNNRTAVTSILAYGEVRENDFTRPLDRGSNLVASGYPLDQSPSGTTGREMTLAQGVFGSRDAATADSIFVWNGDANAGASGYTTYFLNYNPARTVPTKWARIGDPSLSPRDIEKFMHGNRSAFISSKNGVDGYTVPSPWTP